MLSTNLIKSVYYHLLLVEICLLYTSLGKDTVDPNVASELFTSQASSYNTVAQTQTTQGSYSAPKTSVGSYSSAQNTQTQQAPVQKAQPAQSQSSYTSNVSGSEAAAKAWIAGRESGGSYSARNGQYIGTVSYTHLDVYKRQSLI